MSNVFFTADTHFGHARIIELCNRPFGSVEEMDETMIARWNAVVGPKDTVWHLGDFCLKGAGAEAAAYRACLNGTINLIWGNHDRPAIRQAAGWWGPGGSRFAAEISVDGWDLTLCHYALRVWNGSHKRDARSLMLYGHSHGMLAPQHHSLDVGVDCWNFTPITLEQIIDRLRGLGLL